ncbi:MAG: patatin-like phospholipase family protein [Nitrospiraceae bacterium]|nr:patatin-like phospholipase family protein [Nitrospiraceae bacterium]
MGNGKMNLRRRASKNFRPEGLGMRSLLFVTACLLVLALTAVSCAPTQAEKPAAPVAPKVALVLGAGAARGFAHIGVLKVLAANGIPINMIVGTSAGSLVAALYAYGYNPFDIQKLALSIQKSDIADFGLPDDGFIRGRRLQDFVNKAVKNTPIEKMKVPLYIVATDLQSGSEVVFGRGNTGMAVRASCSIPGVFRPELINGRQYVDGGVVSPVAVDVARKYGANLVIAVDISSDADQAASTSTIGTILRSVDIMSSKICGAELAKADIVIRPKVGEIGAADFSRRDDAIMEGEKAALAALPAIRQKLALMQAR